MPNSRVANEDYFRAAKDSSVMKSLQKKQTEKTMARTRFDEPAAMPVGQNRASMENGDVESADLLVAAVNNRNRNPHTVKFIDPNMDPKHAIHRI